MDYTIYTSNGAFFGTLSCSQESLAPMIPEGGFYVEGHQHTLSSCVNGALQIPTQSEIQTEQDFLNLAALRELRNDLLDKSDWTQSPDSPLSDSKKAEWATYRQQLRDLPANTSDPSSPNYPSPPS